MAEMTEPTSAVRGGDRTAETLLFESVYSDLRRLAQRHLEAIAPDAGRADQPPRPAESRAAHGDVAPNDPPRDPAVVTRALRKIVIDHARSRQRAAPGGSGESADLPERSAPGAELLQLDAAMQRLAVLDPPLAQLVELRFYGGLGIDELTELTGTSSRRLQLEWRKARAYLHLQLSADAPSDD